MKGPLRWALFAWFLALNQPIDAQEPSKFEKIRDTSPDGKFAVRISCSSEPDDPNNIDSSLITGVELISLSSKKNRDGPSKLRRQRCPCDLVPGFELAGVFFIQRPTRQ